MAPDQLDVALGQFVALRRHLTSPEQERLAKTLLPWAEEYITKKLGRPAVEHCGLAVAQILRTYDGRGELRGFILTRLVQRVTDGIRATDGRKGTTKHAGRAAEVSLMDHDKPHAKHRAEHEDVSQEVAHHLQQIAQLVGLDVQQLAEAVGQVLRARRAKRATVRARWAAKAVRLRQAGWSLGRIAREVGVSRQRVQQVHAALSIVER